MSGNIYGNQEMIELRTFENERSKNKKSLMVPLGYGNPSYLDVFKSQDYLNISRVGKSTVSQPVDPGCGDESTANQSTSLERHTYETIQPIDDTTEANNAGGGEIAETDSTHATAVSVDEQPEEFDPSLLDDESVNIFERISLGKRNVPFWNYAIFAAKSVVKEVEKLIFLDVYFIISALFLVFISEYICQYLTPMFLFFNTCYGILGLDSGILFICLSFRCCPSWEYYNCCLTLARVLRFFMVIFHILGSVEIYKWFTELKINLYPERENHCFNQEYLVAIYLFTSAIMFTVLSAIIATIAWFFI